MSDYAEYIKGGDILLAPSLDYKHQYIVRCDICKEYYGDLEIFLSHSLRHYDVGSNVQNGDLATLDVYVDEQNLFDDKKFCESNAKQVKEAVDQDVSIKNEQMTCTIGQEVNIPLTEKFKSVKNALPPPEQLNANGCIGSDDEQHGDKSLDELLGYQKFNLQDKSNMQYVKTFMKSKENVISLIEAYKNESHLWNFSSSVKYRKKEQRLLIWKKISTVLRETKNIDINSYQVAASLIYLRQKYRERKRNSQLHEKNTNEMLPVWAFKHLNFLNAYVESKPIALLDVHQDLSPKQTKHVLDIFQRCTHLWDTNTVEYHCSNKRKEAFMKMMNLIKTEMDLEVDEESLKSYLESIRCYITDLKRKHLGIINTEPEKPKCHDHVLFLYNHVGPFKCSQCQKILVKPLALKVHESEHNKTVPFKCPICGKEFGIVDTYRLHIKRHMGDLSHKCSECGKKFLRLSDLKEHLRRHTGDKPYCCEICGSSFRHRTGFGMHMKRHGKHFIRFCPYCSKGFYSKVAMQAHAIIHTNERNFVCPTCGKAFKTRSTLKSHKAVHENGHHECTLCGKSFKNTINLWQHTRKHRLNSVAQITTKLISPFDEN